MPIVWVNLNKKLLNGITLINLLSTQKFASLLKHISESTPLTENELKKLGNLLQIDEEQSSLLTQTLTHVWRQSTQFILKPPDLQKDLEEELKLDSEKAEEFVKLWIERTKEDCEDLDKRMKLDAISWQVNVQAASNYCPKEVVPRVRLLLKLADILESEKTESISLDLSEEELVKLYNVVEDVQAKLDNLQNVG